MKATINFDLLNQTDEARLKSMLNYNMYIDCLNLTMDIITDHYRLENSITPEDMVFSIHGQVVKMPKEHGAYNYMTISLNEHEAECDDCKDNT